MAGLVKELDKAVAKNKDSKLAAVVNFTGEPGDEYLKKIQAFGKKHNIKNVALTMTADADRFRVNKKAELTVMHYVGKKVKYNFATEKSELAKKDVKSIVGGIKKILD